MSSNTLSSNQLKFNLNSLMSNLNLVNVIKQPKPIIIENVRQYHRVIPNTPQASSEFKYIDEEKLAMYSFIAKRNLQEKEWRSRFEQLDEKPVKLAKDSDKKSQEQKQLKSNEKTNSVNKKKILNIPTKTQAPNEIVIKQVEPQVTQSAVDAKINEMKEIIKELCNSFEELENCLDKYKDQRLRLDCVDADEEDKKIRIQNEKIKNSSRLMYNFQNQLRICEMNLSKVLPNEIDNNQKIQTLGRLVNTNRYITRAIENFIENYPYRNDNSDKLYKNLFKHLQSSIEQFLKIYPVLDSNLESNQMNILDNKIKSCDKLIKLSQDVVTSKISTRSNDKPVQIKKKTSLIMANKRPIQKLKQKQPIKKIIKENDEPLIKDYPNLNAQQSKFEKKNIQTARLFPSTRVKSASPVNLVKKPEKETMINDLRKIIKTRLSPSPQRRAKSLTEQNINNLRASSSCEMSNEKLFEPARKHLISPNLSKIGHKLKNSKNDLNVNANALNETFTNVIQFDEFDQDAYDELVHLKRMNDRKQNFDLKTNFNQIISNNSRFNQRRLNFNEKSMLNDCIDRIDHIKDETDAIRRKYEMLKYNNELIPKSRKNIPYAECYLKIDESDQLDKLQNETLIEQDIYQRLNKPNQHQLDHIFDYRKRYERYTKQSALSEQSSINDLMLFEKLSDDLFNECLSTVYGELENVSEQLTQFLVDNELKQD